jgi:hypothetical protein
VQWWPTGLLMARLWFKARVNAYRGWFVPGTALSSVVFHCEVCFQLGFGQCATLCLRVRNQHSQAGGLSCGRDSAVAVERLSPLLNHCHCRGSLCKCKRFTFKQVQSVCRSGLTQSRPYVTLDEELVCKLFQREFDKAPSKRKSC